MDGTAFKRWVVKILLVITHLLVMKTLGPIGEQSQKVIDEGYTLLGE